MIRCRANRECSEDAEVVWCLYMYHPSEDIELCFNFSSGEISMTDYARRLGINEILYREVFLVMLHNVNIILCMLLYYNS